MSEEETETLRVAWQNAVADSNRLGDLYADCAMDDPRHEMYHQAWLDAQAACDTAYMAYAKATENWVLDAPIRATVVVMASRIMHGDKVLPSVTFAFGGTNERPITVTLAGKELDLRRFQNALNKEITNALRAVR